MKREWMDKWYDALPIATPIQEPDETTVEMIKRLGSLGHCTRRPGAHCNRWQQIAERLYKELDAIEVMSDPTLPAPDGIDRAKQINMFARDAVEYYILKTTEKT